MSADHSYSPVSENVVVAANAEGGDPAGDALQFTTARHGFLWAIVKLIHGDEDSQSKQQTLPPLDGASCSASSLYGSFDKSRLFQIYDFFIGNASENDPMVAMLYANYLCGNLSKVLGDTNHGIMPGITGETIKKIERWLEGLGSPELPLA